MQNDVIGRWTEDLAFDITVQGHRIAVDSAAEFGGKDRGPTPKTLLIAGLAGCTGMDVVAILRKMKVEFDHFEVAVGHETTSEHPKVYSAVHIVYTITGQNIDRDRVEQAVELSLEKYCGVSATLRHTAQISHEIKINLPPQE